MKVVWTVAEAVGSVPGALAIYAIPKTPDKVAYAIIETENELWRLMELLHRLDAALVYGDEDISEALRELSDLLGHNFENVDDGEIVYDEGEWQTDPDALRSEEQALRTNPREMGPNLRLQFLTADSERP